VPGTPNCPHEVEITRGFEELELCLLSFGWTHSKIGTCETVRHLSDSCSTQTVTIALRRYRRSESKSAILKERGDGISRIRDGKGLWKRPTKLHSQRIREVMGKHDILKCAEINQGSIVTEV